MYECALCLEAFVAGVHDCCHCGCLAYFHDAGDALGLGVRWFLYVVG